MFGELQVVAPTIQSPACQEQVVEAAKVVAKSVEGVVDTSRVNTTTSAGSTLSLCREVGSPARQPTRADSYPVVLVFRSTRE